MWTVNSASVSQLDRMVSSSITLTFCALRALITGFMSRTGSASSSNVPSPSRANRLQSGKVPDRTAGAAHPARSIGSDAGTAPGEPGSSRPAQAAPPTPQPRL
ncbi:hypothetical protein GCM10020000_72180 [Streptomyces olivoverticillatus]